MKKRRKTKSVREVQESWFAFEGYVIFALLIGGILLFITAIVWFSVAPEAGGNMMSRLRNFFWASIGGGTLLTMLVLLFADAIGWYDQAAKGKNAGKDTR